jgi:hypothetical protein
MSVTEKKMNLIRAYKHIPETAEVIKIDGS